MELKCSAQELGLAQGALAGKNHRYFSRSLVCTGNKLRRSLSHRFHFPSTDERLCERSRKSVHLNIHKLLIKQPTEQNYQLKVVKYPVIQQTFNGYLRLRVSKPSLHRQVCCTSYEIQLTSSGLDQSKYVTTLSPRRDAWSSRLMQFHHRIV